MWWTSFFEKLKKNSRNKKIQRQFIVILALLVVGFFVLGYWKFNFPLAKLSYGLIGAVLGGGILYAVPKLVQPLLYLWLLLGMILGEIMSFIILGIIYYLLFFPITFIKRKLRNKEAKDQPGWHSRKADSIDYKKFY